MHPIELLVRCAMFSLLILLAVILIRDHRDQTSGVLGAAFAFGGAWDGMWPVIVKWSWTGLFYPMNLLSMAALFCFWLLAKSLFEDSFRWRWWYLLVYVLLVVFCIGGSFITFGDGHGIAHWIVRSKVANEGVALIPLMLMIVLLVLWALCVAFKDWRIDLVESRRRGRAVFVLAVGAMILAIAFSEFLTLGTPRSVVADTVGASLLFLVIFGFSVWFLQVRLGKLAQSYKPVFPSESPEDVDLVADGGGMAVIDELNRLMADNRLFCEEGLTIRGLAARLDTKEYILRRLINGHLGYRNFNQFLNQYRIEEAARRLIAPQTRDLSVLNIALQVGYRSLTVFNKAFRETHGVTPTEYRSRCLSKAAAPPASR